MNWKEIKQFNQLFIEGKTSVDLLKCSFAKRAKDMGYIVENKKNITKTDLYDNFYIKQIAEKYDKYNQLLERYDITNTNLNERELENLVKIENNKELILDNERSIKEISTLYFDNAKYLKNTSKLFEIILKILEVSELPVDEYDQQYLLVLHCKNKIPKAIILCENKNNLTKPRLKDVELWYAGGRNTAKLKYIIEPTIPFYYLCDWDNRGIEIYQDIKKNIFPNIEILVPQKTIKYLDKIREWKTKIDLFLFSDEAQLLLQKIIPDKWIEEESINHSLLKR
jgi:hypothetical protein